MKNYLFEKLLHYSVADLFWATVTKVRKQRISSYHIPITVLFLVYDDEDTTKNNNIGCPF